LPGVFGNLDGFWIAFMLEVFFCDLVLKGVLLTAGARLANGWLSLLPCAFYSVAAALQHFLYFQRLDVFAVATTTIALVLVPCARWFAAGLLIGIAGGTKLYALLFAPALAFMAWRQEKARRFLGGLYASFFPLAVLGVWIPWWEFALSHTGRGLQVESLYASLLWLLNKMGILAMEWVRVADFFEVQGPGAAALSVASKVIWGVLVVCSVWRSCRAARVANELKFGALVQTIWLPVLAFVTFGPVLSTQFMLWVAPLAALVVLDNGRAAGALYMLAAVLTPVVFPSPEYVTGLTLAQTLALVTRNLLLVALWVHEWLALGARHKGKA